MDVSNTVNSTAGVADAFGMKLLSKVLDSQTAEATALLQGFSSSLPAPHPYLGKMLDIRA